MRRRVRQSFLLYIALLDYNYVEATSYQIGGAQCCESCALVATLECKAITMKAM